MSGKKKKKTPWLLVVLLLLLLSLAGAVAVFLNSHVFVAGRVVSTEVTELDLSGREVGSLLSLKRCRDLKELDLRGCDVSEADLAALREALPACVIRYDIIVGENRYDADTAELTLPDLPEDWKALTKLAPLRSLTAERCTTPSAAAERQRALPACAMDWKLGLGGEWFDVNTEDMRLTLPDVGSAELLSQLPWFPALKSVTLENAVLSPDEQRSILAACPGVEFRWPVQAGDQLLSCDVTELSLAGEQAVELSALEAVLDLLPSLRRLDFTGSAVPGEERMAFMDRHPELEGSWTVSLMGTTYPWNTQLLDFNNVTFTQEDFAALEDAIPQFPLLEQVEMCDTGVPYTALDALNKKYENVKIVWMVRFGTNNAYALRTDKTYFRLSEYGEYPPAMTDEDARILGYCTDMVAIDLGHQNFTSLSWLEGMTHLKYLIIVESPIQDLSSLSKLKELVYLEIFKTDVTDLAALKECPSLKALNCCYIKTSGDKAYKALKEMPQLEYLWYCGNHMTTEQLNSLKKLNTKLVTFTVRGGESSGGRWRYMQYYYDMRDALGHAWYMPSGTQGSDPENPTTQIIIDDAGTKFYLENYDGSQKWWLQPQYAHLHPYIIGVTVPD